MEGQLQGEMGRKGRFLSFEDPSHVILNGMMTDTKLLSCLHSPGHISIFTNLFFIEL